MKTQVFHMYRVPKLKKLNENTAFGKESIGPSILKSSMSKYTCNHLGSGDLDSVVCTGLCLPSSVKNGPTTKVQQQIQVLPP